MAPLGLQASYYGHAAAGLLHVRPVLDLHSEGDMLKFRQVSNEVSALVKQFKGSLAGEHGVGIARTEYMREQLGDNLLSVMAEIKASFDPHNLFNPGKIIHDGRFHIDENLRVMPGRYLKFSQRIISSLDTLGKWGCKFPRLANIAMNSLLVRSLLSKLVGLAWQRPLPTYAPQRFDKWFWRRRDRPESSPRGRVILW